jgi:drug/metabolite transporter (DMT)-like permease
MLPDTWRPFVGAAIVSMSGVWVRLADVEPARSAFLRNAYALPVLVVLVALERRRQRRRGVEPAPLLQPWALAAGLFWAADLTLWHAAIGILGAGLGTVLPSVQVVVVGLASVVLLRERPRVGFWVALPVVLAALAGLGLTGRSVVADGSVPLGVGLGTGVAVVYAVALLLLRRARAADPEGSGVLALLWLTVGGAAGAGAVAAATGGSGPAGWPADGWLVALALGSQVVGWLLLTSSMHRLPALATSVALLLQPTLAVVWGVMLLGEPVGGVQLALAAVLLVGVAVAHRAVAPRTDTPSGLPSGDDARRLPAFDPGARSRGA